MPNHPKNAKVNGKKLTTKSTPKSILKGMGDAAAAKKPKSTKQLLEQAKSVLENAKLPLDDQQAKLPSGTAL
jgi:hypothetical protein